MPVGAMIGSAAAGLGGAALSSSASKSAAKTQSATADRAAELQNQQFEKLLQLQMPGYNRGEQASSVYMQALGIPSMTSGSGTPGTAGSGLMTGPNWAQYVRDNPDLLAEYEGGRFGGGMSMSDAGKQHYQEYGKDEGRAAPAVATAQQQLSEQVMNTPGYQAQLDQGIKSIDRAAPLTGGMYSGRRMKALNDYGQNTFGSYYQDWMNRVGGVAGQGQQVAQNVGQAGMQNARTVGGLMMTGANARAQGSLNSASAWSGALGNASGTAMYGASQGWFGK